MDKVQILKTATGFYLNMSAEQLLKILPSQSIDFIFTDPPYGIGFGEYDNARHFYNILDELYRVSKKDTYFAFWWAIKKMDEVFYEFKNSKWKYVWTIIVSLTSNQFAKSFIGDRGYSPIIVFKKGNPKVYARSTDILPGIETYGITNKPKDRLYKPTFPNQMIVGYFTRENDIVLDPFGGMASIPAACHLSNRKWLSCEINPKIFEKVKNYFSANGIQYNSLVFDIPKLQEEIQAFLNLEPVLEFENY